MTVGAERLTHPEALMQPQPGPWHPFHEMRGEGEHRDGEFTFHYRYALRGEGELLEIGRNRGWDDDFKPLAWLRAGPLTPEMLHVAGSSYLPWSVEYQDWRAPYDEGTGRSWVLRGRAYWFASDRLARHEVRAFPADQASTPLTPLEEGGHIFGDLNISTVPSDRSWMAALADWLERRGK